MTTLSWWRDQNDLDPEQKAIIQLDVDGDYLLLGPPGCGKTNILALRGTYVARMGKPNIVLLSFTRTLKEFISAGTQSRYGLPDGCVQTFRSWSTKLLTSAGIDRDLLADDPGGDFNHNRQKRIDQLKRVIADGAFSRHHYQCILVDEVQDFWADEIQVVRSLTRRLFAAGDGRQRIYDRNEGIRTALELGCQEKLLTKHYRNGRKICEAADRILPDPDGNLLINACQYKEEDDPSVVELYRGQSLVDQFAKMRVLLHEQLRLYRGQEFIGVLCPTRKVRKAIWDLISDSDLAGDALLQHYEAGYEAFDLDRPICVMTAHAAKGLEFKSVHIPGAEEFGEHRQLAFTGFTRAKTSLFVYHTKRLKGWLSAGFLQAPIREPSLEELF